MNTASLLGLKCAKTKAYHTHIIRWLCQKAPRVQIKPHHRPIRHRKPAKTPYVLFRVGTVALFGLSCGLKPSQALGFEMLLSRLRPSKVGHPRRTPSLAAHHAPFSSAIPNSGFISFFLCIPPLSLCSHTHTPCTCQGIHTHSPPHTDWTRRALASSHCPVAPSVNEPSHSPFGTDPLRNVFVRCAHTQPLRNCALAPRGAAPPHTPHTHREGKERRGCLGGRGGVPRARPSTQPRPPSESLGRPTAFPFPRAPPSPPPPHHTPHPTPTPTRRAHAALPHPIPPVLTLSLLPPLPTRTIPCLARPLRLVPPTANSQPPTNPLQPRFSTMRVLSLIASAAAVLFVSAAPEVRMGGWMGGWFVLCGDGGLCYGCSLPFLFLLQGELPPLY